MRTELHARFENQLPKPNKLTFESLFGYVAGLASIVGLIAAPFVTQTTSAVEVIYLTSLSGLVAALIIYAFLLNRRKLHRYAQSVIYIHFVNHVVRDCLRTPGDTKLKEVCVSLLGAIASCYSILTAKNCRAFIVELGPSRELEVYASDPISTAMDKRQFGTSRISDNSPFNDLWFGKNGYSRYFLSNNLPRRWKRRQFESSAFQHFGSPEVRSVLGFEYVANWQAPFRSILILPIRCITEYKPPTDDKQHGHWDYWGFLCVDCNTKNVFDSRYSPELGGAFADAIYTLMSGCQDYANASLAQQTSQKTTA